MKRTLVAIGFAVLLSMMYVPYGRHGTVLGHEPFWQGSDVMVTPLILQTVFASVAAAMLVNIRLPTKNSGLGRRLLSFLGWLLVPAGIITALVVSVALAPSEYTPLIGFLTLLFTIVVAVVMVNIRTRKDHRERETKHNLPSPPAQR